MTIGNTQLHSDTDLLSLVVDQIFLLHTDLLIDELSVIILGKSHIFLVLPIVCKSPQFQHSMRGSLESANDVERMTYF